MKIKICSNLKCLQPKKLLSEFHKDKSREEEYCNRFKYCIKEQNKNKLVSAKK